jgi:hypothetical protein
LEKRLLEQKIHKIRLPHILLPERKEVIQQMNKDTLVHTHMYTHTHTHTHTTGYVTGAT